MVLSEAQMYNTNEDVVINNLNARMAKEIKNITLSTAYFNKKFIQRFIMAARTKAKYMQHACGQLQAKSSKNTYTRLQKSHETRDETETDNIAPNQVFEYFSAMISNAATILKKILRL